VCDIPCLQFDADSSSQLKLLPETQGIIDQVEAITRTSLHVLP